MSDAADYQPENGETNTPEATKPKSLLVKRHGVTVRLWHWINAAALIVLLMSGLTIFNGHPRLYWGEYGSYEDSAWLEIGAVKGQGKLALGDRAYDTTGVLGVSKDPAGNIQQIAFPSWSTIPSYYSLSAARRWHFAFAWIFAISLLIFMILSLANQHIMRDLHIRRSEWSPHNIWRDIRAHIGLRFPKGHAALKYNILQKFSYIAVIFILLPLMIFTGIAMSPAMNAAWPWLLDIFGGRQSARSIHFIAAFMLCAFFILHIIMVVLSGPIKGMRAMITGNYRIDTQSDDEGPHDAA